MAAGGHFCHPQPQPRKLMSLPLNKSQLTLFLIAAAFLCVVMPVLNATGTISHFTLNTWGKYLCYALLAISVDLLWGYTGLLSLGQALFFSVGGYMIGMHLMLMIGDLGVYARSGQNANLLPDFLVFLGHTELPTFWKPFFSLGFALLMVLVLPGGLAYVFGFLAFRSRIKGVYFSILTQALTYGAALMFFRNDMLMGGNNGFTDFRILAGADLRSPEAKRWLYIITAAVLCLVFLGCKWLTTTKFGLVQRAVRDSETRVLFSGYAAANYKLFVFVLSAMIAAIGGALFVPQVGIINPSEMTPERSLEAVVWVAVGGRGTLIGPILGAVGINALKSWATRAYPDLWLIILGGMFVLVVLFMPKGLVGLPAQLRSLWQRRRPTDAPAAAAADARPPANSPTPS
jgi:urea transport system permease protein